MEGGRMGSRSSTRHGGPNATVFHGPVRKWRKAWVPIQTTSATHASSRVHLFKWSPIVAGKDEMTEEVNLQNVKFVPISVVMAKQEELKKAAEAEKDGGAMDCTTPEPRKKTIDVEMLPESSGDESDG